MNRLVQNKELTKSLYILFTRLLVLFPSSTFLLHIHDWNARLYSSNQIHHTFLSKQLALALTKHIRQ